MAQKRSATPYIIGGLGLAALVGGALMFRSKPAAADDKGPTPPPDPTPPPPPETKLPPAVTSAMFPPGGTILVIGDQTAEKLGTGIDNYLRMSADYAGNPKSFIPAGYPPPRAVGIWSTQGATIESTAAWIRQSGVPAFQDTATGAPIKPDVIVVALGWAEAKNGVSYSKQAISDLAAAFGNGTTGKRHPSVLWALPPSDGDMSSYLGLQVALNAVATTTLKAPLSNIILTPKAPPKDEVEQGGLFDANGPTMLLTYTGLDCCMTVRDNPDWSWQVVTALTKGK